MASKHSEFWEAIRELQARVVTERVCSVCGKRAFHQRDCSKLDAELRARKKAEYPSDD